MPVGEHELGGAAADVDDERPGGEVAAACDAAQGHARLVVPGEKSRVEAVAPLDLAEEGLPVLGVPHGARRDRERALRAGLLEHAPVAAERVANARERGGEEEPPLVDALAQAGDREPALDLPHGAVLHVRDEQARRVRTQVDDADAGHLRR